MQNLIAAYLFQTKTCPLPGIGTLVIKQLPAQSDFINKSVIAPKSMIVFEKTESDAGQLIDYIAAATNSPVLTAINDLSSYCNNLKQQLTINSKADIKAAGNFFSQADGTISFEQFNLPGYLQLPVLAEKVVHPEAPHTMIVGDKETTNVQMAEYYTESPVAKNYWWLWALLIFAAALLAFVIYLNQKQFSSSFGNISPVV